MSVGRPPAAPQDKKAVDPLRTDTRAKRSGQPETISTPAPIDIDRASVEIRIGSRWDDFAGMWKQWSALATLPGQDGTARPEFCVPCWAESPQGSGYVAQAWLGDELVAVAPMWSRRVGLVRTLRPIGSGPVHSGLDAGQARLRTGVDHLDRQATRITLHRIRPAHRPRSRRRPMQRSTALYSPRRRLRHFVATRCFGRVLQTRVGAG